MRARSGSRLSLAFLLVILIALIVALYQILGGNESGFPRLIGPSSEGGFIEQVTGSLHALGDSLAKVFSNILH